MPEIDNNLFSEFERSLPHHEMVLVEGGEFLMGDGEEDAFKEDGPVHKVRVPSFYMGKYPVTQALWVKIMDNNPSRLQGDNRPVENVSWKDTQGFLKKLNEFSGKRYRLPTESEWEYAARGGSKSEGYLFSGSDRIIEVGWHRENSGRQTHPVGQKLSNELGLHDMSGNVWEWVEDQWHSSYENAPTNGSAWVDFGKGALRICRGGSRTEEARYCRISFRYDFSPSNRRFNLGFRLALSL